MLTSTAKTKIANFITGRVSDVKYRIGSTWYDAEEPSISVSDGIITVDFVIEPSIEGSYTIVEVGLFDLHGIQWFSNQEQLIQIDSGSSNSLLYRYTINLQEI